MNANTFPSSDAAEVQDTDVAIVGVAGRFPKAANPHELWTLLCAAQECISIAADSDRPDPSKSRLVKAASLVAGIDLFDAAFFGYSPREADLMDPQQRIFLECAWEALEDAGYNPLDLRERVGVFAGTGLNTYAAQVAATPRGATALDGLQLTLGNDKDYLATRVSYKLNLTGPSVAVQTACSSSLVATHLACQSLIDLECDMALAGGVSIRCPSPTSYHYTPGSIFSPDGHCRAFDVLANGTIPGNGAGIVVLKRLAQALQERDQIYAVIRGSAVNNDGHDKAGFTAPSLDGQIKVIRAALTAAGTPASSVTYVETHGTATPLGDAIEIAALKEVFGSDGRREPCTLGAIKTNLGHLDTAAGIAGLIKTALCLKHAKIPPTLHFTRPNPALSMEGSWLRVGTTLAPWARRPGSVRRAGVSSFGIGGTNAHAILDEAPSSPVRTRSSQDDVHILPLSARTPEALEEMIRRLADYLSSRQDLDIRDVAYTLQVGRTAFQHRLAFLCSDLAGAIEALRARRAVAEHNAAHKSPTPPLVLMFPGQGSEHPGMAAELYRSNAVFRSHFDCCLKSIQAHGGPDISTFVRASTHEDTSAAAESGTLVKQLGLFAVEYALANLLVATEVRPSAVIGHSLGEITAACLAGVFTLETAIRFLLLRGTLMQERTGGAMLAVALSEKSARELCTPFVGVAAVNSPLVTVLSGPSAEIAQLHATLRERDIVCSYVNTIHAFHSPAMESCVEELARLAASLKLQAPAVPLIAVDGNWANAAWEGRYWGEQLTATVRFASGIDTVAKRFPGAVFVEVGPSHTLTKLARQTLKPVDPGAAVIPTLSPGTDSAPDLQQLSTVVAQLWCRQGKVNWMPLQTPDAHRTSLPTYPFQRSRHWAIDETAPSLPSADASAIRAAPTAAAAPARLPWEQWISIPVWTKAPALTARPERRPAQGGSCVLLSDSRLGPYVAQQLRAAGIATVEVRAGTHFARVDSNSYSIDPTQVADYVKVFRELVPGQTPHTVAHLWGAERPPLDNTRLLTPGLNAGGAERVGELPLLSLMHVARASQEANLPSLDIYVFLTELARVHATDQANPAKAMLLGAAATIPLEMPTVSCSIVDLPAEDLPHLPRAIVDEMCRSPLTQPVAYRSSGRWMRHYLPFPLQPVEPHSMVIRRGGTYLITGGSGGLGRGLASKLVAQYDANVALVSRSANRVPLESLNGAVSRITGVAADVTDLTSLENAVASVRNVFGEIHGVFHLAGVPGGGLIQTRPSDEVRKVLEPKALGAVNLLEIFRDSSLDFMVLFSSISAVAGALGQCDYNAANAFLDALPASAAAAAARFPVCSLAWDAWQSDTWQDELLKDLPELHQAAKAHRETYGIRFEEGLTIVRACLEQGIEQCAVTTRDLSSVIAAQRRFSTQAVAGLFPSQPGAADTRPAHLTAPTQLRAAVFDIWSEVLGTSESGGRFLDLGGHSLLAIQLAARIKNQLNVQVELKWLLANPTVEELAELLSQQHRTESIDAEVSGILAEIEALAGHDTAESIHGTH